MLTLWTALLANEPFSCREFFPHRYFRLLPRQPPAGDHILQRQFTDAVDVPGHPDRRYRFAERSVEEIIKIALTKILGEV